MQEAAWWLDADIREEQIILAVSKIGSITSIASMPNGQAEAGLGNNVGGLRRAAAA
jgi:hypothetical protein